MDEEYFIEEISLFDDFEEFRKKTKEANYFTPEYRTDSAGFSFLRVLAHNYFKNEIFPNEWRNIIKTN